MKQAELFAAHIYRIVAALESAERMGESIDVPEGARYITISDTNTKRICSYLRYVIDYLEHHLEHRTSPETTGDEGALATLWDDTDYDH